jgi:hypothetical protein
MSGANYRETRGSVNPAALSRSSRGADASPGDVRLAWVYLLAVLERRAAVGGPRHLPHTRIPLHPLDTQTGLEASAAQARDEHVERLLPCDHLDGSEVRRMWENGLFGPLRTPFPPRKT